MSDKSEHPDSNIVTYPDSKFYNQFTSIIIVPL